MPDQSSAATRARSLVGLDGLRAVGAVLVLLAHTHINPRGAYLADSARLLIVAASIFALQFFIISAFLLFEPMAYRILTGRPPTDRRSFWNRRIKRIGPPAWIAMAVYVWFVAGTVKPSGWSEWAAMLTFNQEWSQRWLRLGIPPLWTMCVEVAFYLLLPFLASALARLVRGRSPRQAVRLMWIAIAVFGLVGPIYRIVIKVAQPAPITDPILWVRWPFAYFDWFAVGLALAVLSAAIRAGVIQPERLRWLAVPTGLYWVGGAGFGWLWYSAHTALLLRPEPLGSYMTWTTLSLIAATFLAVPIFVGTAQPGRIVALLSQPAVRWFGTISFGIYLWHWAILTALHTRYPSDADLSPFARDAIVLALSTLAGALSWYAIERPLLSSARRSAAA